MTRADRARVSTLLRTGMLARGRLVGEFEDRLSAFVGAAGSVCVGSGTAALTLSLLSLAIGPGNEVVLPTYTCPAVLQSVVATGAVPVLCDVGPRWTVTAREVAPHLSPRTAAVVVVHALGLAADVPPIVDLGVPVVEDFCQALGARRDGQRLPIHGAAAVYSFHATKCLTTGEGGAVASTDERVVARARLLLGSNRVASPMSDLQAALGLSQWDRYAVFLERRRLIAGRYFDELRREVTESFREESGRSMFYRFLLRIPGGGTDLRAHCERGGIMVRQGVDTLLHRGRGGRDEDYPNAVRLYEETVSIPIHPALRRVERQAVVGSVTEWLEERSP